MKKFLPLAAACVLACIALAGCGKKEETTTETSSQQTEAVKKETVLTNAVILDGSYWNLNEEGKMDWALYAVPGTTGQVYGTKADDGSTEFEFAKDVVRTSDGGKRNFYRVFHPDAEESWWVQEYALAINASAQTVIEDDVSVYRTPDLAATSTRHLSEGTIVAVFNESPDTAHYEYANLFAHIQLYDQTDGTITGYVKASKLSASSNRVLSAQLKAKIIQLREQNADEAVIAELEKSLEEQDSRWRDK